MASDEGRFGRNGSLKKKLDTFGNIFGINICFVVGSLPIFTIGASLTAAYATAIRIQEGKEETVLHCYLHEFKRNFKQATLAFFLIAAAAAILTAEVLVANTTEGPLSVLYTILFYAELLIVALGTAFLFPLIACYENTLLNMIRNSFLLSVGYVWSFIKIAVAWFAPIALSVIYPVIFLQTWYLWLLILFGAIIYGTSFTARHVFSQNEEASKEK